MPPSANPRACALGYALWVWLASGCDAGGSPNHPAPPSSAPAAVGVAPRASLSDLAQAQSASPLRRLTRAQLRNAIQDLLGVDISAASLPGDGRAGPFTSNATAGVSRLSVDQYMSLAEQVADDAALAPLLGCALSAGDEECALAFIRGFGARVYRREVPDESVARLREIYTQGEASGGFERGVRGVLAALLQSPFFLYQVELAEGEAGAPRALSGDEIAARLAFGFWGTTPDVALRERAARGELDDEAGVRSAARELLDSPRARAQLGTLHIEWLLSSLSSGGTTLLRTLDKNRERYPIWDQEGVAAALERELVDFADFVVRRSNGTLSTLLTAPFGFPSGPLFELYGLTPAAVHDPAEPVAFDPAQRRGILTLAAVQAALAHPKQPSIVARGLMLFGNLLCQPVPEPPPGAIFSVPEPDAEHTRLEALRAHEASGCASCHLAFDPLGLAFEHYGASGEYRRFDLDDQAPVADAVELASQTDLDGAYPSGLALIDALPHSPTVQRCTTLQWFRFMLGRWEKPSDAPALAKVGEEFAASGFRLRDLLIAIAASDAFRFRAAEEGQPEESAP